MNPKQTIAIAAVLGITTACSGSLSERRVESAISPVAGVRTLLVAYDDLNLMSDVGRDRLRKRVERATDMLCSSAAETRLALYEDMFRRRCFREIASETDPQIAAAIAKVRSSPALARGEAVVTLRVTQEE